MVARSFPGHPDLAEITRGMPDDQWLPTVGARRLVVITRDQRIRYRAMEKRMWVAHEVRGFVLTGRRSQSTVDSLAILTQHWRVIERLALEEPEGPWMYAVTLSGFRPIELG